MSGSFVDVEAPLGAEGVRRPELESLRGRESIHPPSAEPDEVGSPNSYPDRVQDRSDRVRLAELVAALSLGVDLGFGQPMEHVLRQCLIALRIAERVGLGEPARATVYYTALLINV
jgi:hypothetical protein